MGETALGGVLPYIAGRGEPDADTCPSITNVGAAVEATFAAVVCTAGADGADCGAGDDTGCAEVNGKVLPFTTTGGL
jgi:hypothetical protein